MEWWRGYFDEDWLTLHEPLFAERVSRRETGAMLELLGLPAGARVLDVPCGWGRHTNLLPAAGVTAVGADRSVPLLRRAAGDARQRALPPRFAAADLRALPFRAGEFDAVVNVFTSLGLFERDADEIAALAEARRVLRPGGALLLESMHRDDVVCAYASSDEWTLPDGTEVSVERRFDAVRGVSHETMRWRRDGESGRKQHTLRLRTATEIARLLRAAGFGPVRYFGDWDGREFGHDSPRLIAHAERGA